MTKPNEAMKKEINCRREDITEMRSIIEQEEALAERHSKAFRCRQLSAEEIVKLHCTCNSLLEGSKKSVSVRAELFVLCYLVQPELLFNKAKVSPIVIDYAANLMNIRSYNLSKYKSNLIFLYFNDHEFRGVVNDIIAIVKPTADMTKTPRVRKKGAYRKKKRKFHAK